MADDFEDEFLAMYGVQDGPEPEPYDSGFCIYAGDLNICTHCEHWDFEFGRCSP